MDDREHNELACYAVFLKNHLENARLRIEIANEELAKAEEVYRALQKFLIKDNYEEPKGIDESEADDED